MENPGPRDLVVMGASAGGVEALCEVMSGLTGDLPACVLIVLHVSPDSPSALGHILSRAGPLPCRAARDGDRLTPGRVLVAPPDHHLTVEDGRVRVLMGPRENCHRPSVDALFRSAALNQGPRVVGVVLSGTQDDGAAGLALIKDAGGAAIVQDPREAAYGGMPRSAIAGTHVDAVVPLAQVATAVTAMVWGQPADPADPADPPDTADPPNPADPLDPAMADPAAAGREAAPAGEPFTTTCPECGGVLSERPESGLGHWSCRVGHRYSLESLLAAQADDVEAALWAAVRALDDRRILLDQVSLRRRAQRPSRAAEVLERRAAEAGELATVVRAALARAAARVLRDIDRGTDVDAAATPQGRLTTRWAAPGDDGTTRG